jgi:hypothetical protein
MTIKSLCLYIGRLVCAKVYKYREQIAREQNIFILMILTTEVCIYIVNTYVCILRRTFFLIFMDIFFKLVELSLSHVKGYKKLIDDFSLSVVI